jgi:hypothetical protein
VRRCTFHCIGGRQAPGKEESRCGQTAAAFKKLFPLMLYSPQELDG